MILFGKKKGYSLLDIFDTDVAAGSVNGTTAEPTGQVRTVTDTNSKLSISGGILSFATGAVAADGVFYPGIARLAGKMLLMDVVPANTDASASIGWDSNQAGNIANKLNFGASGALGVSANGESTASYGVFTAVPYKIAIIIRATGIFFFIKGGAFTNWTLLSARDVGTTATLYPAIEAIGIASIFTVDNVKVPSSIWLPSPIVSDSFDRANGALGITDGKGHAEGVAGGIGSGGIGLVWTGSTWAIVTNVAVNTPTTVTTGGPLNDGELLTDPGIETWASATDITNWAESKGGSSTVNRDNANQHSGTYCARLDIDSSNSIVTVNQSITPGNNKWVKVSMWMKASTSGKTGAFSSDLTGMGTGATLDPGTTYTQYFASYRITSSAAFVFGFKRVGATSASLYFDDYSVKILNTPDLFTSVSTSTKDYVADVKVTCQPDNHAGMVLNLDSTSNPQNYIIAELDRGGAGSVAKLLKCVAGTYTEVISAAITYSAGAVLRVIKDGQNYSLYYNNAQVGSTTAISDTGVINNTLHGLFSTFSGNSLNDFVIYPRGTSNEYSELDKF